MTVHPEAYLISAVLQTGAHQVLAARGITSQMFHAYPHEATWLEQQVTRYGRTPSKQALRQQFPSFVIYKVTDVEHWCEEVRTAHVQASLIQLADRMMNHLDAGDEQAALRSVQTGLTHIQTTSSGVNPDFDIFEQWQEVYDTVSDRVDRYRLTGLAGIPSGFATLDGITGGFQPGWFSVIAARLGQGKTWTGVRMAWAAASHHRRVCYFSLEQSRFQIAMRVHAFASRQYAKKAFDPSALARGSGFDLMEYKKFLADLKDKRGNGAFYINDTSRGIVTPATIRGVIIEKQPDIVFVDYLTLLGATTDDWRGTARLSADIQAVANGTGVPIIAMSQVNRLGISKEPPGAEHLSQADAIGQDADLVLTMTQRSSDVMKLKVAKFRHGPGGQTWNAKFSPGNGEYDEITPADADAMVAASAEVDE